VTLPRTPNVKEIVEEFKAYVESKKANQASSKPTYVLWSVNPRVPLISLLIARRSDAVLAEIMNGIVLYFDKALGNNLLYRFERAQYVDIRRKTAEVRPMSEIYGAEHLLRLFGA
jgi:mortality factor 4-like protein 1